MPMNSTAAIRIEHISKKFQLGKQSSGSIREYLSQALSSRKKNASEFWALQDVTFTVDKGDVMGIIGNNGAGKSTLLKILSRISPPTRGRISYQGRIASLLEVGTGFHPELTGKENIFINGAILGMRKKEIARKLDEIIAFSGIEKFIDTPVKRYSSGMYVRLAFAVAAHLDPDILVIDEVLAVGDAEFQKKCLGKMQDLSRNTERTILFVSHNLLAVKELCNKGIVLDHGKVKFEGNARDAVNAYQSAHHDAASTYRWESGQEPGNEQIKIMAVAAAPVNGDDISIDEPFEIMLEFDMQLSGKTVGVSAFVVNEDQVLMFESFAAISEGMDSVPGTYRIVFSFPAFLMNSGRYFVKFLFAENQQYIVYNSDFLLNFEMQNISYNTGTYLGRTPGVIKPRFTSTVTRL